MILVGSCCAVALLRDRAYTTVGQSNYVRAVARAIESPDFATILESQSTMTNLNVSH